MNYSFALVLLFVAAACASDKSENLATVAIYENKGPIPAITFNEPKDIVPSVAVFLPGNVTTLEVVDPASDLDVFDRIQFHKLPPPAWHHTKTLQYFPPPRYIPYSHVEAEQSWCYTDKNTGKRVYDPIDLVAHLTAAVQDLRMRVRTLEGQLESHLNEHVV
jgi:hypothetical protein